MLKNLILFLFITISLKLFADLGPKHSESIYITFNNVQVDSLYIIVQNNNYTDTAFLPPFSTAQFWTSPTLNKQQNKYQLFTHGNINAFKIMALVNNTWLQSAFITNYPGSSTYVIGLSNNKSTSGVNLIDESNLLHQPWSNYFMALLLTILLEVIFGMRYYFKFKTSQSSATFITLLALTNVVTHLSLWVIYSHSQVSIFLLELGVVIAETFFWKLFFKINFRQAFFISLFLNFISWAFGYLILLLATQS